jgi:hypothetical protein
MTTSSNKENSMKVTQIGLFVSLALLFALPKLASAQQPADVPPNEQVYAGVGTVIVNVYSDVTTGPPLWGGASYPPEPTVDTNAGVTSFAYGTSTLGYFVGTDRHVYELVQDLNQGALIENITTLSGAPLAVSGSPLASILNGEHGYIYFFDSNWHVHQLYWNNSGQWLNVDATAAAGAPSANPGSHLASFLFGGYFLVDYITSDGHIHELYTQNGGTTWATTDITAAAGAPTAALGSGLTGFKYPDGHAHVFYFDGGKSLHELYSNGSWFTDTMGAPSVTPNVGSLTSLYYNSSMHVFFLGTGFQSTTSDIFELAAQGEGPGFNSSHTWQSNDVTTKVGGPSFPQAATVSPLVTYVHPPSSTVRLYYVAPFASLCQGGSCNPQAVYQLQGSPSGLPFLSWSGTSPFDEAVSNNPNLNGPLSGNYWP